MKLYLKAFLISFALLSITCLDNIVSKTPQYMSIEAGILWLLGISLLLSIWIAFPHLKATKEMRLKEGRDITPYEFKAIELEESKSEVFSKSLEYLKSNGCQVIEADASKGFLRAKNSLSWRGLTHIISVEIYQDNPVLVRISCEPALKIGLVDSGYSYTTVNKMIDHLQMSAQ